MPVALNLTQLFTNNAVSLLTAPITSTSTSLTVMAGHGSMFPQPTGDGSDYFLITLEDQGATRREIIKVTGRAGDVLTFSLSDRGLEGTTPQNWNSAVGDETMVDHRITAETLTRALQLPLASGAPSSSVYDQPFTLINPNIIELQQNYKPGTVRLYIGGARQKRGVDFTETSPNRVTLTFSFSAADIAAGQNVVIDFDPE